MRNSCHSTEDSHRPADRMKFLEEKDTRKKVHHRMNHHNDDEKCPSKWSKGLLFFREVDDEWKSETSIHHDFSSPIEKFFYEIGFREFIELIDIYLHKKRKVSSAEILVSSTGIEPVSQASEARIFPLNYEDKIFSEYPKVGERQKKSWNLTGG